MDTYKRIEAELAKQQKSWVWLGEQIGEKPSAMGNWKKRGVPKAQFEPIADALRKSMDWIYGRQFQPEWPFTLIDPERYMALHPESKGAAQLKFLQAIEELEKIEAESKLKHTLPEKANKAA